MIKLGRSTSEQSSLPGRQKESRRQGQIFHTPFIITHLMCFLKRLCCKEKKHFARLQPHNVSLWVRGAVIHSLFIRAQHQKPWQVGRWSFKSLFLTVLHLNQQWEVQWGSAHHPHVLCAKERLERWLSSLKRERKGRNTSLPCKKNINKATINIILQLNIMDLSSNLLNGKAKR